MAVRPSPLHDGVRPLTDATCRLCLSRPDWTQHFGAIGGRDPIKRFAAELWEYVGFERADRLRGVLRVFPAGFEFAMKFPRRFFESERGGGNAGGLLFAVAFLNGVFARFNQTAHGERLFARIHNLNFRINPRPASRRLPVTGLVKRSAHLLPVIPGGGSSPVTFPSKTGLSFGPSALACLSVSAISAHRLPAGVKLERD